MKGAIFASNNGKGHITRSINIANFLSKYFKIDLHLNLKKISKIRISRKINKINFQHGRVKHIIYNLKWSKKYENSNKYNFIISDNLPEVIKFNSVIFIYANFFWHDILNINHLNHFKKINNHLQNKRIPIFGNYMFQKIDKKFKTKKIGFIGKFKGKQKKNKKNILVSLGTADISIKTEKKILNDLKIFFKKVDLKNYNFFIDKKYFLKLKSIFKNIQVAKYDAISLSKMSFAIIKPGFGIITDCLKFGIPMISIKYKFNNEFVYNSKILSSYKLLITTGNLSFIEKKIKLLKISELNKMVKVYRNLRWNGERDLLNHLKKSLYKK